MTWSSSLNTAALLHGPFEIGMGAAGSEITIGDCQEIMHNPGITFHEVKGGDLTGRETITDWIINGVNPMCSFIAKQTLVADIYRLFPYLTYTAGGTSKAVQLNIETLGGLSMSASSARIVFHRLSVSAKTDYTKDLVFTNGIIIPQDNENDFSGADNDGIACLCVGLPDSDGLKLEYGVNAT